jgi:glycosyltransferase involved in cell wall biosynthesis
MRILHVITGFIGGGAETMLAKLLRATAGEHEARVVSVTSDGLIGERIRQLGVETTCLGLRRGVPDPRAILALARIVRAYRPDLVQTWMYHADLLGGLAAALAGRTPVVWGVRNAGPAGGKTRWLTRQTLRACAALSSRLPARIVTNSQRARAYHVSRGYDASRFVVIPNGFDVAAFAPMPEARAAVRAELGVPAGAPVVAMVARLDPQKDLPTFAAAAGHMARARPDARFLLCGENLTPDNPVVTGWFREAGALEQTRLLGRRSDVPRVMSAADVFTLSSATEAFPNALGEAMACGVPSVVTDVGDCRWILGDAGRVVPPGDPRALAAGWGELLDLPPEQRRALGAQGRDRVVSEFALERIASRYGQLYQDVLGGGVPRDI